MHGGHFYKLRNLIADTPPFSQIDVFVFGLEGVELAIRSDRNNVLSKLGATMPTPQNLMSLRDQPLSHCEVNPTPLSGSNQPFFDELLFQRMPSDAVL